MPRFRPRDLRRADETELRRQLNEVQREISSDIDLLSHKGRTTDLQLGDYSAAFGDLVRMAPPSAGARLILPEPLASRVGERVTLTVEAAVGAVTVEVVNGTIDGQDTLDFHAGLFAVDFVLSPDGWFTSTGGGSAEPVITFEASDTLTNERVLTNSTSNTVSLAVADQAQVHRAALTGAISAAANANATLFAGIRDNGSLETARGFINVLNGTNTTGTVTQDAGNDELELRYNVDDYPLSGLADQAANTIVANATGGTAAPTALTISADSFPARVGGNLVSHPFSTLAGGGLTYSAGVLAVNAGTSRDITIDADEVIFHKSRQRDLWWEDFGFINAQGTISTAGAAVHANNTNWYAHAVGASGSISFITAIDNHPGIWRLTTGATNLNSIAIYQGAGGTGTGATLAQDVFMMEGIFRIPTVTSFQWVFGWVEDFTTFQNFILVDADSTTAGGLYRLRCTEGGAATNTSTTGIAFAAGDWFVATLIQPTLGNIDLYIDDVLAAQNANSNVPDAEVGSVYSHITTRTNAARTADIDFIQYESRPHGARTT